MLNQIILITDGCSNVGISPVVAAAQARVEQIVVNVIGIAEETDHSERGLTEIEAIAKAGGGLSRVVSLRTLTRTVQMMTQQTVAQSIQQVVNQQLQQILGSQSTATIETLPLDQRAQVVQAMDEMGEDIAIRVALLIDASASMKPKLRSIEEAIQDLVLSLHARKGESEIAVFQFPGAEGCEQDLVIDSDWTKDLAKISNLFYKLNMRGTTPTGPALLRLVSFIAQGSEAVDFPKAEEGTASLSRKGLLRDYVI